MLWSRVRQRSLVQQQILFGRVWHEIGQDANRLLPQIELRELQPGASTRQSSQLEPAEPHQHRDRRFKGQAKRTRAKASSTRHFDREGQRL